MKEYINSNPVLVVNVLLCIVLCLIVYTVCLHNYIDVLKTTNEKFTRWYSRSCESKRELNKELKEEKKIHKQLVELLNSTMEYGSYLEHKEGLRKIEG